MQYAAHIFNEEIDQLATIIVRVLPSRVVRGRRNPLYFGLPARLKEARENWSFDSVALAAGLSDGNTIFQLERKRGHVPRLDTVEKIALALGLSPGFLAFGLLAESFDSSAATDGLRCAGMAERLRATRIAAGLSMRAVARSAGLTDTAVRTTETAQTMPSLETAERLAVALAVSPAWLAFGEGPRALPPRRRTTRAAASASP